MGKGVVAIDAEKRLRRMYDESYFRLLSYALGYLDRASAEEIVSETFVVAWRRLDDVPSRELPWLFGVARNLIRERCRADQRLRTLCTELSVRARTDRVTVGDIADDVAERAGALRALAELSDADRELLTLLAWHGLTNREAAEVLGIRTATLLVRVHRARHRLRAALTPTPDAAAEPSRGHHARQLSDLSQELS
jgi:RNA polymerase sigma-70 factor (ECF subfamily)